MFGYFDNIESHISVYTVSIQSNNRHLLLVFINATETNMSKRMSIASNSFLLKVILNIGFQWTQFSFTFFLSIKLTGKFSCGCDFRIQCPCVYDCNLAAGWKNVANLLLNSRKLSITVHHLHHHQIVIDRLIALKKVFRKRRYLSLAKFKCLEQDQMLRTNSDLLYSMWLLCLRSNKYFVRISGHLHCKANHLKPENFFFFQPRKI